MKKYKIQKKMSEQVSVSVSVSVPVFVPVFVPIPDKNGFYKKEDIEKMETRNIIELFIKETCYQDVLNTIRSEKLINQKKEKSK